MMEVIVNGITFQVRWKHFRPNKKNGFNPYHVGTKCVIDNNVNTIQVDTLTTVHPKDQFCKSIGRKESLKKALRNIRLSKEDKKVFWNTYLKHFPIKKEKNGGEMATK